MIHFHVMRVYNLPITALIWSMYPTIFFSPPIWKFHFTLSQPSSLANKSEIKQSVCLACLCLHDTLGLSWWRHMAPPMAQYFSLPFPKPCRNVFTLLCSSLTATRPPSPQDTSSSVISTLTIWAASATMKNPHTVSSVDSGPTAAAVYRYSPGLALTVTHSEISVYDEWTGIISHFCQRDTGKYVTLGQHYGARGQRAKYWQYRNPI